MVGDSGEESITPVAPREEKPVIVLQETVEAELRMSTINSEVSMRDIEHSPQLPNTSAAIGEAGQSIEILEEPQPKQGPPIG